MRRKMIMGPALAATLLLTALLPSAASTPVPRWTRHSPTASISSNWRWSATP